MKNDTLEKISSFELNELANHTMIEVYVKEDINTDELAEILFKIEDVLKENNLDALVDFLRG